MQNNKRAYHQPGFGLPEILISLLLANCIMLGLINHYLGMKRQYQNTQMALEQAFELQSVIDLIRDSVRRAGFTPCLRIDHLDTVDKRHDDKKLIAIDVDGSSLKINRMNEFFDEVIEVLSPTELLTSASRVKPGQSVLIADCHHAEVQVIHRVKSSPHGRIVTLSKPLAFSY